MFIAQKNQANIEFNNFCLCGVVQTQSIRCWCKNSHADLYDGILMPARLPPLPHTQLHTDSLCLYLSFSMYVHILTYYVMLVTVKLLLYSHIQCVFFRLVIVCY